MSILRKSAKAYAVEAARFAALAKFDVPSSAEHKARAVYLTALCLEALAYSELIKRFRPNNSATS